MYYARENQTDQRNHPTLRSTWRVYKFDTRKERNAWVQAGNPDPYAIGFRMKLAANSKIVRSCPFVPCEFTWKNGYVRNRISATFKTFTF